MIFNEESIGCNVYFIFYFSTGSALNIKSFFNFTIVVFNLIH
nr:MAG TPA: hypothetical protein [Caudoviricetes sp.]